jgi:hypothetical protein
VLGRSSVWLYRVRFVCGLSVKFVSSKAGHKFKNFGHRSYETALHCGKVFSSAGKNSWIPGCESYRGWPAAIELVDRARAVRAGRDTEQLWSERDLGGIRAARFLPITSAPTAGVTLFATMSPTLTLLPSSSPSRYRSAMDAYAASRACGSAVGYTTLHANTHRHYAHLKRTIIRTQSIQT